MILVTVGTQLAFDRLLEVVDEWAAGQQEPVIAQVGPSKLKYRHIEVRPFISPSEMEALFAEARLVLAHAGMGSILSALKHRKPIVIVPRKASLGEHRNDHQLATARWMVSRPGVSVAWEPHDALSLLDMPLALSNDAGLSDHAGPEFIGALSRWLNA